MPYVVDIVEKLLRGNLDENQFDFVDVAYKEDIPQNIILYIIGGCTYAEA